MCDGVSLAPLQPFTQLTRLCVSPVRPYDISFHLSGLTQLQSLQVGLSPPTPWEGRSSRARLRHLVPLAALTRLAWLQVKLGVADDDEDRIGMSDKVGAKLCV